ncbi:hypothetical protein COR50_13390 [Chitinophaga caeni]|uniref:Prolyl-tRNA synthetase n=2 Tax=Chitinophaga caeni TaxID=2029983 RepID=A0A291QVW2_9BACT|nr:hypothetical protein COR50_13390 [Chitinophaga caeni]
MQMKPILYGAGVLLFLLSSCSSAYKTAKTPDDVYYSSGRSKKAYASNKSPDKAIELEETQKYVTYDDDGNATYVNGSEDENEYARRINRFHNDYSGNYWDGYNSGYNAGFRNGAWANSWYSPYSMWYSPYSSWYSPYYSSWGYPGWSMGFGLGWRSSFYFGYGWGSPFYNSWYSPWYYPGHYYYGGGGYYGHPGYYTSRPGSSWGPRSTSRGSYTRTVRTVNNQFTNSSGARAPRVVRSANDGGRIAAPGTSSGISSPRRVFRGAPNERAITSPAYNNYRRSTNNGSYSPPSRPTRVYRDVRPSNSNYNRSSAPTRSYTPSRSSSAPVRSVSPPSSGSRSSGASRPVRSRG